jgi:hypothetical protein
MQIYAEVDMIKAVELPADGVARTFTRSSVLPPPIEIAFSQHWASPFNNC